MSKRHIASPVLQNWSVSSETVLRGVAVIAILSFMALLWNESLPDYAAYKGLFENDASSSAYNPLFGAAVQSLKFMGLGYESFRGIVLFAGVLVFTCFVKAPVGRRRNTRDLVMFYCAYCMLAFVFLFEFYEVRLRAGISCLLFTLALFPEIISAKKSAPWLWRSAQAVFLAGSLWLHSATFVTIFLFCVPPIALTKYFFELPRRLIVAFAVGLAILWFGLFYQVVTVAPSRGEVFFSQLNPVRFFALFAIPITLAAFDISANRSSPKIRQDLNLFPIIFSINYVICATVLGGFYFTGGLETAGEAIVRVMTLSSLPAVFIVMRWGVSYGTLVPTYLLLCNGLFFIKTVYL